MANTALTEQDWQIRLYLFNFLLEHARPPTVQETARQFGLPEADARLAYYHLDANHRIFLDPGTDAIRMLHPFSALPTPYLVTACGRQYWANCAWDALGIPAALHEDASVAAILPATGESIRFGVQQGQLVGEDIGVVHFPKPFHQWYDDLIDT
jgi:hypothetical protein